MITPLTTQELFLLFTCDEWKSRDSRRLRGIFATLLQAKQAIFVLAENEVISNVDSEILQAQMSCDAINTNIPEIRVTRSYLGEFEPEGGFIA